MMARTHYEVLGVNPNASADDIRRAFRAAARRLHPDVNTSKDSAAQFAEASTAYEVLSDPAARREYDDSLRRVEEDSSSLSHGQAHYSWTNVATHASSSGRDRGAHPGKADLDEMYNAFFGSRKSGKREG